MALYIAFIDLHKVIHFIWFYDPFVYLFLTST